MKNLKNIAIALLFSGTFSIAATEIQNTSCRSELSRTGISATKQNEFCKSIPTSQWNCSQVILKKFHSLELAKDICLSATTTESACYVQVINRNYDPYVAKRVCKLKANS